MNSVRSYLPPALCSVLLLAATLGANTASAGIPKAIADSATADPRELIGRTLTHTNAPYMPSWGKRNWPPGWRLDLPPDDEIRDWMLVFPKINRKRILVATHIKSRTRFIVLDTSEMFSATSTIESVISLSPGATWPSLGPCNADAHMRQSRSTHGRPHPVRVRRPDTKATTQPEDDGLRRQTTAACAARLSCSGRQLDTGRAQPVRHLTHRVLLFAVSMRPLTSCRCLCTAQRVPLDGYSHCPSRRIAGNKGAKRNV